MCHSNDIAGIDDYNTTENDNHICELDYEFNETHIIIEANGFPNHDLESGPGCCASAQDHVWMIPLEPTNDTGCDPTEGSEGCSMAPERGPIAFAVNGVSIYGPEDGPGGDAVAGQEGKYEEASKLLRQPAVVDYFLQYVQREGRDKAPDQIVVKLEETLNTLKEITGKESMTEEDVTTIHSATGAVLTLL